LIADEHPAFISEGSATISDDRQPIEARDDRVRVVTDHAKNLLKLWPALWTFAEVDDVEPTNNAAERGLRAAVIYRKLSLGSRSQGGERTIERLLSVDQTCRLQRRSLYAYLADALTAKARGDPVPSLTGA
jgi:hypothetical protein